MNLDYEAPDGPGYSLLLTGLDSASYTTVEVKESKPAEPTEDAEDEDKPDPVKAAQNAVEKAVDGAESKARDITYDEAAPQRKAEAKAAQEAADEQVFRGFTAAMAQDIKRGWNPGVSIGGTVD